MPHSDFEPTEAFAQEQDVSDPLRRFRKRFLFPDDVRDRDGVYFVGHSLGLQPRNTLVHVTEALKAWEKRGVEAHFEGDPSWLEYATPITEATARVVGALPEEVVLMNALTVNLHLMLASFYRPTPERHAVLMESSPFPSDRYAVASQIRMRGFEPDTALIEANPGPDGVTHATDDLEQYIREHGSRIGLVLLAGVNYLSGQAFDIRRITQAAHSAGCVVGFDLAHAVGNVPLRLHDWNVDFAVWCSYKYLNGGPGCVAGCFVHERHHDWGDRGRLEGWWGNRLASRFEMEPRFEPERGAAAWQLSNPPIIALAPLRGAMDLFDEAGLDDLVAKSDRLTGYLEFLLDELAPKGVRIITPRNPVDRGAQLSFRIAADARSVFDRLVANGIHCDWREPDTLRAAPVPLYNSFRDVYRFYRSLDKALTAIL